MVLSDISLLSIKVCEKMGKIIKVLDVLEKSVVKGKASEFEQQIDYVKVKQEYSINMPKKERDEHYENSSKNI